MRRCWPRCWPSLLAHGPSAPCWRSITPSWSRRTLGSVRVLAARRGWADSGGRHAGAAPCVRWPGAGWPEAAAAPLPGMQRSADETVAVTHLIWAAKECIRLGYAVRVRACIQLPKRPGQGGYAWRTTAEPDGSADPALREAGAAATEALVRLAGRLVTSRFRPPSCEAQSWAFLPLKVPDRPPLVSLCRRPMQWREDGGCMGLLVSWLGARACARQCCFAAVLVRAGAALRRAPSGADAAASAPTCRGPHQSAAGAAAGWRVARNGIGRT